MTLDKLSTRRIRRALPRSALTLAIAGAIGLASLATAPQAQAQSTVGTVYGKAGAGDVVHVSSASTGFSRDVTVGANGQFEMDGVPLGNYTVNLLENGNAVATQKATVVAGSSTQVNFNAATGGSTEANAEALNSVQVTAPSVNSIDVRSTTVRTTFTADQLQALPVPRDTLSVAALTPGTVSNNTFGVPSFGGSSSAENSYYIDGFNVTDMYNSMAFNKVPWFAIAQEDVQTGSYGPEYGFSTGGVVSVNTKRGTNEWHGGVDVQWTPSTWEGHAPDEYYSNGQLARSYRNNSYTKRTYSAWIGGPIIKDKLFFFGTAQFSKTQDDDYSGYDSGTFLPTGGYDGAIQSGVYKNRTNAPYYLGRIDWNITNNNTLSYTTVSDVSHESQRIYDLTYENYTPRQGDYEGTANYKSGGKVNILKDVWQLPQGFTLTMMYGQSKYYNPNEGNPNSVFVASEGKRVSYNGELGDYAASCPFIVDDRAGYIAGNESEIQGCNVVNSLSTSNAVDRRKTGSIDLEWNVGNHDVKIGASKDSFDAKGGSAEQGWYYLTDDADGSVTGTPNGDYAEEYNFQTSATVGIKTTSAYIKDGWTIDDNWLFNYGIRYDKFTDWNGAGDNYSSWRISGSRASA